MPTRGMIRFSHTLRIGFSVMIANNDQVVAERQIDAAWWRIMNRLWPDQRHHEPAELSSNPDNTRIEGITRGLRRHVFGPLALNNETPLAELQYDVSIFFRTGWPPIITDDLDEIDITTGIKIGDTQDEMDQRQQIPRANICSTFPEEEGASDDESNPARSRCAACAIASDMQKMSEASSRPASASCPPRMNIARC